MNGDIVLDAVDIHSLYKYSFRDSMIIAAAVEGGAGTILSEDLSDSQTVKDVVIRNPFKKQ